ncbi:prepilin peptidase [bacterium]|nr:prepilin peptidase [bacterium]
MFENITSADLFYWFTAFYVFIIGLCMGSFINVVALRSLAGEDFVMSRSKCPKCNEQLRWYNNIPLLSFIFQRGKCQFCAAPISWQYPLAELVTGASYLLIYWAYGLNLKTVLLMLIFTFFILLSIEDIKEQVILESHGYILLGLGVLYNIFYFNCSPYDTILGIFIAFVIFEVFANAGYLFIKHRFFGEGDTIIAMAMGAFFGAEKFLYTMLLFIALTAVVAILYYVPVLLTKYFKAKNYKLFYSLVGAILACVVLCVLAYSDLKETNPILLYILLGVILIGVAYALWNILTSLKNQEQIEASMLPLGPILALASMVSVFLDWQQIVSGIFG